MWSFKIVHVRIVQLVIQLAVREGYGENCLTVNRAMSRSMPRPVHFLIEYNVWINKYIKLLSHWLCTSINTQGFTKSLYKKLVTIHCSLLLIEHIRTFICWFPHFLCCGFFSLALVYLSVSQWQTDHTNLTAPYPLKPL